MIQNLKNQLHLTFALFTRKISEHSVSTFHISSVKNSSHRIWYKTNRSSYIAAMLFAKIQPTWNFRKKVMNKPNGKWNIFVFIITKFKTIDPSANCTCDGNFICNLRNSRMKHDAYLSLGNEIHLHFIYLRKICRIKLYEVDAVSLSMQPG